MSNTYVIHNGRVVADPEPAFTTEKGQTVVTLRLADNPPHAKDPKRPARFVRAKCWGPLAETAARLRKGDVVVASGELGIEAYGEDLQKTGDTLRVNVLTIVKSESFFGGQDKEDRPAESKGRAVKEDPFA